MSFSSLAQAFAYANQISLVWKVSFNAEDGSWCRFVRADDNPTAEGSSVTVWVFEPIVTEDFWEPNPEAVRKQESVNAELTGSSERPF